MPTHKRVAKLPFELRCKLNLTLGCVKNYLRYFTDFFTNRHFWAAPAAIPPRSRPISQYPHAGSLDLMPLDWPGREHSRLVACDGLTWHVQQSGAGPTLLLLHGTGGSTHSWRDCIPALETTYTVVAIDLPGHGFTDIPTNFARRQDVHALTGMARAVGRLLHQLDVAPSVVAGHSAGVPLAMQLALDGAIAPTRIVGFNPALVPPPEIYSLLIAPLLGTIVERDIVAEGGAWLAGATKIVGAMLATSGTPLRDRQLEAYRWLCTRPAHVHAALTMMSRWDLPRLLRDALTLQVPLRVVAGMRDRWVPPSALKRVVDLMPNAEWVGVEAGHLIPDECPEIVVREVQ